MLRIVVPIKQVAVLDDEFELDSQTAVVDPDLVELELNEWDSYAVEAALQIRERAADDEAEVIVVTVGPDESEEALRSCLAMGADRAIRVWDEDAFADPEPLAVAAALSAVARQLQPDLVLCGVQSSDAASGATGIALAGALGLPHIAVARSIDFDTSRQLVAVDRELEAGLIQEVSLATPALLTVQTGINEPRYATLRAIKQAEAKPLERLGLGGVGLDASAIDQCRGARTVALTAASKDAARAEMIDGDTESVATAILQVIRDSLRHEPSS